MLAFASINLLFNLVALLFNVIYVAPLIAHAAQAMDAPPTVWVFFLLAITLSTLFFTFLYTPSFTAASSAIVTRSASSSSVSKAPARGPTSMTP